MPRSLCAVLLSFLLSGGLVYGAEPVAKLEAAASGNQQQGIEFFEKHIRPVLVANCYECHSTEADASEGGLLLDSREAIRRGGESGPAVTPGNTGKSLLLSALRYDGLEMPPDNKLPADVVARFEAWIKMGAPDPREPASGEPVKQPAAEGIDFAAGKKFWSFQRPQLQPLPAVKQRDWPVNRIDYFTLARMEQHKLQPASAAQPQRLVRRMYYDVTGLPPAPAEISKWTAAIEQAATPAEKKQVLSSLADELVSSPHYGERWARLWLDVARYAEDQAHIVGNNKSLFYPNAHLYRDWVINAFNNDLPYTTFIQQQLAADLVDKPSEDDKSGNENLVALGFIGLGPKYYRRNSPEVMADEWEDRVDTVTRGLLGLTVACARCHDHKFDPVETEDYYALAGVFASTRMVNFPLPGKKADGKNGETKSPGNAMHIVTDHKPHDIKVHIRGNVKTQGDTVPRRFLKVLCEDEPQHFQQGSGRAELAAAITSRNNPLAARVYVNRIWGQLMGSYLVPTPSNYGLMGQQPTHPQLLDDLAVRFMDNGWSTKWLVREIIGSQTYQQSALGDAKSMQADPSNTWLARMNRKRLSVESYRDGVLAVSGQLQPEVGGPSIDVASPDVQRRSIYGSVSRFQLNPMLAMFDFPDPNTHSAVRTETTTALQKLFALNSPFMVKHATHLATRLEKAHPGDLAAQVNLASLLAFGRAAEAPEVEWAVQFVDAAGQKQRDQRRIQFAQIMLISNEMMYVD